MLSCTHIQFHLFFWFAIVNSFAIGKTQSLWSTSPLSFLAIISLRCAFLFDNIALSNFFCNSEQKFQLIYLNAFLKQNRLVVLKCQGLRADLKIFCKTQLSRIFQGKKTGMCQDS